MTYLSIIISKSNQDNNQIIETLKSLESQTFIDYEIIITNKASENFKTLNSTIKNKIIFTNTNKISENIEKSKGEYILFLNEYPLQSTNTLKTFTDILKQEKLELLHSKNENTQNNILPLKNLLYNTFYNKEFIKNRTCNLSFDTPFLSFYFGTNVLMNLDNYKITHEHLTKKSNEQPITFNNIQEINDFLKSIRYVLFHYKSNLKEDETIYDFSKNMLEINYKNIPSAKENEIQKIRSEIQKITEITSNKYNKTIHYYISKYLRTFYDLIYNSNTQFDILVSIIIPTYNVEEYIDDCLTSLLEQKLENIEIICIDDKSTDQTPQIIKFYQQKDKRIKYYQINKKKGSGGCRNYALTKAKGKYIQYIDSDDFLDINALKELYEKAEREKTQILIYKATSYIQDENKFIIEPYYEMKQISKYQDQLLGIKDIHDDIFKIAVSPWNKLYLKSFLTSINIKFPENLIHQDNPFFYEAIINADRIFFIEKYYYNRRRRNNSITQLKNHVELDVIEIIELILKVFFKYGVYEEYKQPLLNKLISKFKYRYSIINKEYQEEFYEKSKIKLEKFKNEYKLEKDLNMYLYPQNKRLYENFMTSKNFEEFNSKYYGKKV